MNLRAISLKLLIGSVLLSAMIGIVVVLFGNFGGVEIRILMTTLLITVTSILGLACGAYLETGRGKWLPVAGIVLSIAAAVMTLFIIWNVFDRYEDYIKATTTVTLLALAASHLSLLSLAKLDRRFAWSRTAAFVFVSALTALLLYLIWFAPDGPGDLLIRVIAVLSILVAAVTVVTPVFHRLSSAGASADQIDAEIRKLQERIAELEAKKTTIPAGQK